jgi:transcriptional regulator with XRE-family HTH domain
MVKKRLSFSDEIRQAVGAAGLTRYRICKELGIAEPLMSRFMAGKGFLGQGTLDAIAGLLDLHVAVGKPGKLRRPKEKG